MTSRIKAAFAAEDRTLLIPYLTAGWPAPADTVPLLHALEEGGADLIEIGVPFSDPSADGTVIQRANEQALAAGANLDGALAAAAAYRDADGQLPVVLMGYANSFYRYGFDKLAKQCVASAVDGVLAVDWPPTPRDRMHTALQDSCVDRIVLIASTTPAARMTKLSEAGSGYAYYVAVQGVTGTSALDLQKVTQAAQQVRSRCALPVAVGFGVRTAQDCEELGRHFDAVIVGSRLIEEISDAKQRAPQAATRLLAAMRDALA